MLTSCWLHPRFIHLTHQASVVTIGEKEKTSLERKVINMDYHNIIYKKEKTIATITLNRPEKGNAYTQDMIDEIVTAIKDAEKDDEVRVLVITGAGRSFCTGYDLGGFALTHKEKHPLHWVIEEREGFHKVIRCLKGLDKPTIASVNGSAIAAGFVLALACDIRIVSERARLGDPSLNFGFASDEGLTYFLPRIAGVAKAVELIMLGEIVDAIEAQRIGLVNKVVPPEELEKATTELATRLAGGPPIAQRLTKRAIYSHAEEDLESSLEDICLAAQIANETEDVIEGVKALQEKRPPIFKGR